MFYEINILPKANDDLVSVLWNMYDRFRDKDAALNYVMQIEAVIFSLQYYPRRYALHHLEYLAERGLRFVQAKNYIIFYKIEDIKNKVHIVRIVPSAQNLESAF